MQNTFFNSGKVTSNQGIDSSHSINNTPLSEIIRPKNLSEFVGQEELVGKDSILRKLIESDQIMSMILWGPPGVGKTTLARIIANETKSKFMQISAVTSGKKDMRYVIERAGEILHELGERTILFIDEIHRFNKAQQDFLLPFVEDGTIILIGATTENPSFEVIAPLLSRCRVFTLKRHKKNDLAQILTRASEYYKKEKDLSITFDIKAEDMILDKSNGDPRMLINALEMAVKNSEIIDDKVSINTDNLVKVFQTSAILYDKHGEEHYNIASAFIKSMRASDVNASLYWLARMITAGEKPEFIARRCQIFASEDVGNADPKASILANSLFDAVHKVGWPESRIILSQLVIYLCKAPRDNSAYLAIERAMKDAKETMNLPVPLNLRNAPTKLMKDLDYGKGYIYDHDVKGKKSGQQCLPDELKERKYI